jgi:branched-chain amino acid transport system permease protein
MNYALHVGILIGIYLILSQSLNLILGLGQLFNLTHIASYAIGAYTFALLSTYLGINSIICVASALFLNSLLVVLVAMLSIRLEQDSFTIGTLALSLIVGAVLTNYQSVTNGVLGVTGIPRPAIGEIDFTDNVNFFLLTLICTLGCLFVLFIFFQNGFSRSFRAQAEYDKATLALGYNTHCIRFIGLLVASSCATIAGTLFASYVGYIDPSSFNFTEMIFVLTITIVGNTGSFWPGSFWGVVAATIFLVILPEPLRLIVLPPGVIGPARQMFYAIILFGVLCCKRNKIFSTRCY